MNYGTFKILVDDVLEERQRQDERFGEQNHPNFGVTYSDARGHYAILATWCKEKNARRVQEDQIAWDLILLEEVYEALAEGGPVKLREELVQVAAVAVAWIEAIDRRTPYDGCEDECACNDAA